MGSLVVGGALIGAWANKHDRTDGALTGAVIGLGVSVLLAVGRIVEGALPAPH